MYKVTTTLFLALSIIFLVLWLTNVNCQTCSHQNNNNNNNDDKNSNDLAVFHRHHNNMNYYNEWVNPLMVFQGNHLEQNPVCQFFDIIYYINLDNRTDRKQSMETQLQRVNADFGKVHRISAVGNAKFGALGCSLSHIKALKHCIEHGYNNCLILEDDFLFKPKYWQVFHMLQRFQNLHVEWDVLMLSSNTIRFEETNFDLFVKALEVQTTAGYAVNRHFMTTLLENFEQGAAKLAQQEKAKHDYCIDQYWKSLQPQSKWYIFTPVIGHQMDDYSDIEQRQVNYNDKHELKRKSRHVRHLTLSLDPNCPVQSSYTVIRKPLADNQLYVWNEQDKHLYINCQDILAHKCWFYYLCIYAVRQMMTQNRLFANLESIAFVRAQDFDEKLTFHNEKYWGKHKVHTNDFPQQQQQQGEENKNIATQYQGDYYCLSQYVYLHTDLLDYILQRPDLFLKHPESPQQLMDHYDEKRDAYINLRVNPSQAIREAIEPYFQSIAS